MKIFRISFLDNEVLSINAIDNNISFEGNNVLIQQENGRMILAFVKAEDEPEARVMIDDIISTIKNIDSLPV